MTKAQKDALLGMLRIRYLVSAHPSWFPPGLLAVPRSLVRRGWARKRRICGRVVYQITDAGIIALQEEEA